MLNPVDAIFILIQFVVGLLPQLSQDNTAGVMQRQAVTMSDTSTQIVSQSVLHKLGQMIGRSPEPYRHTQKPHIEQPPRSTMTDDCTHAQRPHMLTERSGKHLGNSVMTSHTSRADDRPSAGSSSAAAAPGVASLTSHVSRPLDTCADGWMMTSGTTPLTATVDTMARHYHDRSAAGHMVKH